MNDLGNLVSPQVQPGTILVVPVGSCEQHGPHLPLDTDTRIAVAVSNALAAQIGRPGCPIVVGPAIGIGASGEHAGFPGTVSIGTAVLVDVLIEIVRSAGPEFTYIVFVNGHGGNVEAINRATEALLHDGHRHVAFVSMTGFADAHAGISETSLMLYLHPDFVGAQRPIGATESLAELLPKMRAGGVKSISPNGVLGDSTGASPEQGRELFEAIVVRCLAQVTEHITGPI